MNRYVVGANGHQEIVYTEGATNAIDIAARRMDVSPSDCEILETNAL